MKKGTKMSMEARKKISKSLIGNSRALGFKHTKETRKKVSNSLIGNKYSLGFKHTNETKKKLSEIRKGRRFSLSHRKNMSGEKHWNWKGGISPYNESLRKSVEYKMWRKSIFERDGYTCQWCGIVGGTLHADHIKPFSTHPELRLAIDNGRTLCKNCHMKTDTYAGRVIKSVSQSN